MRNLKVIQRISSLNKSEKGLIQLSNKKNNYISKNKIRLITISSISKFKKGLIHCRCEYVDDNNIYISDFTGIIKIVYEKKNQIISGDFLIIDFFYSKKILIAKSIIISNRTMLTQSGFNKTFINKFLKNDTKLIDILKNRTSFYSGIHDFFNNDSFIEINTPTLVESPGIEKYLEVFSTNYYDINGNEKNFFMPTSPEFSLKEALMYGLKDIYELAKCFRNAGEYSNTHRPEFIMLEWYRAFADYHVIIEDCSRLFLFLLQLIKNTHLCQYKHFLINFKKYEIFTVKELFERDSIDLDNYSTNPDIFINEINRVLNCDISNVTKEDLFFKYMLDKIEPTLGFSCPVFIVDYPYEMTPLSEQCEHNPLYGKRFEVYIAGIEIGNGYGELIDPTIQENRFHEVIKEREIIGGSNLPYPERFINAMKQGIPPCSGVAVGTERLFMIIMGLDDIGDTKLIDIV